MAMAWRFREWIWPRFDTKENAIRARKKQLAMFAFSAFGFGIFVVDFIYSGFRFGLLDTQTLGAFACAAIWAFSLRMGYKSLTSLDTLIESFTVLEIIKCGGRKAPVTKRL